MGLARVYTNLLILFTPSHELVRVVGHIVLLFSVNAAVVAHLHCGLRKRAK